MLFVQTNEERENVKTRLEELEIQHQGLQDLIVTLKDGRGETHLLVIRYLNLNGSDVRFCMCRCAKGGGMA